MIQSFEVADAARRCRALSSDAVQVSGVQLQERGTCGRGPALPRLTVGDRSEQCASTVDGTLSC